MKEQLGAESIIWLKQGLATDETNGHIDNVLSVISNDEICIAWTDDKKNNNYKRVRCILKVLQEKYNGTIHKIDLPPSQYMTKEESEGIVSNTDALPRNAGDLLPASYLNFYFVTVVRGTLAATLNEQETHEYQAGTVLKVPFHTKMNLKNVSEETLEFIVVKAPAPNC